MLPQKSCNCRASKCLKAYCQCFASQTFCTQLCHCRNCNNTPNQSNLAKIRSYALKNPLHKTGSYKTYKGCTCQKTGCLKKYCECYAKGKICGDMCTCNECKNHVVGGKAKMKKEVREEIEREDRERREREKERRREEEVERRMERQERVRMRGEKEKEKEGRFEDLEGYLPEEKRKVEAKIQSMVFQEPPSLSQPIISSQDMIWLQNCVDIFGSILTKGQATAQKEKEKEKKEQKGFRMVEIREQVPQPPEQKQEEPPNKDTTETILSNFIRMLGEVHVDQELSKIYHKFTTPPQKQPQAFMQQECYGEQRGEEQQGQYGYQDEVIEEEYEEEEEEQEKEDEDSSYIYIDKKLNFDK